MNSNDSALMMERTIYFVTSCGFLGFILHFIVDVIENIMRDMSDQSKTRGQIIRELKKQGLIESAKDLKRPNG